MTGTNKIFISNNLEVHEGCVEPMAEKKYKSSLSFLDFAKVGIVVTVLNAIVYWVFLTI